MRRAAIYALVMMLLALAATMALAQGKITVDPNSPSSAQLKAEETQGADSRLLQKITFQAKRKMVRDILADLSKATDVTLKAGHNEMDWQVRDRRMNVFAKDVTLASLMNSIARVMKFKWSKSEKDGVLAYRLYMDRKTLLDADAQRAREEARFEDELVSGREALVDSFSTSGSLSKEDLDRMKRDNPLGYVMTALGVAPAIDALFNEVPAARNAFENGGEFLFTGADLSLEAQSALARVGEGLRRLNQLRDKHQPRTPDKIGDNVSEWEVRIGTGRARDWGSANLGGIVIRWPTDDPRDKRGRFAVDHMFFNPSSALGKLEGQTLLDAMERGEKVNSSDLETRIMQYVANENKKSDFGDPAPEHPDEPQLHEKVKLPIDSVEISDRLEALSSASKLCVVSDCFGRQFPTIDCSADGIELKYALDKIALAYDYNWDKHGSALEFRDRHWFKKRAEQIPEAWLEKWRHTLKTTGMLNIDDLAEIAALTQRQYQVNVECDETLGILKTWAVSHNRELLRLYASLSDAQRSALFSEHGLDMKSVSASQWTLVERLLNSKNGSLLQNTETPLFLIAKRNERVLDSGKRREITYSFKIPRDSEQAPLIWEIKTPT